jgi:hypothetical protein
LVEETGEHGENHRPVASDWPTLSHTVISSAPRHERGSNTQLTNFIIAVIDLVCRRKQWKKVLIINKILNLDSHVCHQM